jgi:hypothetical protein
MTLNPEIQAQAQAEIDSVLKGRLPTIGDQNELPYTNAIALETLRWGIHGTLGMWRTFLAFSFQQSGRTTTPPHGGRSLPWLLLAFRNNNICKYLVRQIARGRATCFSNSLSV